MEAKDTVINPDEFRLCWMLGYTMGKAIIKHPDLPMGQAISIEQAEVTFKAMQESRHSISTIVDVGNDAFKDGKKAGRKEVLDRIEPILNDRLCRSSLKPYLLKGEIVKLKQEWELGEKE